MENSRMRHTDILTYVKIGSVLANKGRAVQLYNFHLGMPSKLPLIYISYLKEIIYGNNYRL